MGWTKDNGKQAKLAAEMAEAERLRTEAEREATEAVRLETIAVKNANKTKWLPAVATVALRNSTYPNPQNGDTVRVTGDASVYRFDTVSGWVKTDEYNSAAIDNVTAQLADTENVIQKRPAYKSPNPYLSVPMNISSIITPSVFNYKRSDGLSAITGWDTEWLVVGEDGQCHIINKHELSAHRVDREPNWELDNPWDVEMAQKVVGYTDNLDSRNTWFRSVAKEEWNYADVGTKEQIRTGYAVTVGTGDETATGSKIFRPPTVYFYREGTKAAQSLTKMLSDQGIMNGDLTKPRNFSKVIRTALDEYFICGSGYNGSTSGVISKATFGKMVLTLNTAKTEKGANSVTSLVWTDYLSVLQSVLPEGELIINIPTIGGQTGDTFYVCVITKDGSNVKRTRLLTFNRSTNVATLVNAIDILSTTAIFPKTNTVADEGQIAFISKGANGVLFSFVTGTGSGQFVSYYKKDTETESQWHNVSNQIKRALGINGAMPYEASWDSSKSRFIVVGNFGSNACSGVLDADCKQGYPLTEMLPITKRWQNGIGSSVFGVFADLHGVLFCGGRQMLTFIPTKNSEQRPSRVIWGLRVKATQNINEVSISEGEAEFYSAGGEKKRVYYAGGTVASYTLSGVTLNLVVKSDGTVGRTGGITSGLTYPEPATLNEIILATITHTAGTVINPANIDQTTFRDI